MSLAYLALDRFRYRSAIERTAKAALDKYDAEGDGTPDLPPSLHNNETVNELKWLCRKDCNGYSPKGWQITIYRLFFRQHTDVIGIIVLGGIAAFALAVGVAFSLERWKWLLGANSKFGTGVFFYACLFALIIPPALIYAGRKLTMWGSKRVNELDGQIAGIMKIRAGQTVPPVLPDVSS